jgi:hypothetical protein
MNPGLPGYNLPGFRMLGQTPDSPATYSRRRSRRLHISYFLIFKRECSTEPSGILRVVRGSGAKRPGEGLYRVLCIAATVASVYCLSQIAGGHGLV